LSRADTGKKKWTPKMTVRVNEQLDKFFADQKKRVMQIGAPEAKGDYDTLLKYWRKTSLGEELRRHSSDRDRVNIEIRR